MATAFINSCQHLQFIYSAKNQKIKKTYIYIYIYIKCIKKITKCLIVVNAFIWRFMQKTFTFGICNYIHIHTYIYIIYILYILYMMHLFWCISIESSSRVFIGYSYKSNILKYNLDILSIHLFSYLMIHELRYVFFLADAFSWVDDSLEPALEFFFISLPNLYMINVSVV